MRNALPWTISHPFGATSLIPEPKWDRELSFLPGLGWYFVFPSPGVSPLQPDPAWSFPACFSPTGAWRQRVSPNCAFWAGVTELPKQRRGNFTEGVNFRGNPSAKSQPALDPTSGRWQNIRLRKYPVLQKDLQIISPNYFLFHIDICMHEVSCVCLWRATWWHFHQRCQKRE